MKIPVLLGLCAALFASALFPENPAPMSTTLKVGDMAPSFTLPSTDGKQVTLTEARGKKNVVLAFFPAAFTGGCTAEMQAYQLNLAKFENSETQVYAVSTDNTPSQKEFAAKLKLTFPILSDFVDRKVAAAYGVLPAGKATASRVTFVIDKAGKISFMEQGKDAIDTGGAKTACTRLAHSTK